LNKGVKKKKKRKRIGKLKEWVNSVTEKRTLGKEKKNTVKRGCGQAKGGVA